MVKHLLLFYFRSIYNKIHEHIYNLKLIEFYFFIKTLNSRKKEKEKELKTIDTDEQSKIIDDNNEETDVEFPNTERFVQKLEMGLTQDKRGVFKELSENTSYFAESIIKQYDEDKIKICKNFKCNYGIEKERKSSSLAREQRLRKFIQNANKELEDTYGKYVKIYDTEIPSAIKTAEASISGKSIFEYDKNGVVAKAYYELSKEVLHDERQEVKNEPSISR